MLGEIGKGFLPALAASVVNSPLSKVSDIRQGGDNSAARVCNGMRKTRNAAGISIRAFDGEITIFDACSESLHTRGRKRFGIGSDGVIGAVNTVGRTVMDTVELDAVRDDFMGDVSVAGIHIEDPIFVAETVARFFIRKLESGCSREHNPGIPAVAREKIDDVLVERAGVRHVPDARVIGAKRDVIFGVENDRRGGIRFKKFQTVAEPFRRNNIIAVDEREIVASRLLDTEVARSGRATKTVLKKFDLRVGSILSQDA